MYTLTISNGSSQNTWLATHLINSQCKTIQCSYSATKSNFLQCSVFVGTVRWSVTRCLICLETTIRRWYAVSKEKTGSATTFRQTVVLIRCSAGTSVPRRYLPNPYITTSLNYWSQDGSMVSCRLHMKVMAETDSSVQATFSSLLLSSFGEPE